MGKVPSPLWNTCKITLKFIKSAVYFGVYCLLVIIFRFPAVDQSFHMSHSVIADLFFLPSSPILLLFLYPSGIYLQSFLKQILVTLEWGIVMWNKSPDVTYLYIVHISISTYSLSRCFITCISQKWHNLLIFWCTAWICNLCDVE